MTKIVWKKFEIMEATKGEDISKKFLQKKKVTGILQVNDDRNARGER